MPHTARIAVIGTGWWATTAHIPALQENPDANLVALSDVLPGALEKAARHYGVDKTHTDFRAMLEQEQLDGVVIAVWHAAHYEVARVCLEHGLHVLLEKPMVLTAPHGRHLTELSRTRGCQLIVGYPWNYNPHVLRAKEVLGSGRLGGIRYINNMFASCVIDLYRGNDNVHDNLYRYPVTGPGDVYSDPERSGGGQGHLQVTHSAALMLHLTGLKPVSVLALMDSLDTRVDVVDAMIVQMDNGALANVGSTGTLHARGPEQELVVQVYCDRGWVNVNIGQESCTIYYEDGSAEELPPLAAGQSYQASAPVDNLVDVIVRGAPNMSPPETGWRTVELLDAAYRSAADRGRRVSVGSLYAVSAG
ncbi:MAG: Gfo/Idh/MocA family oxidoreductase [Caldilineaceae bacterium]|nr:Gfo/Idh/MocA family oxidoreductase [Caldilineaceae bacterium]